MAEIVQFRQKPVCDDPGTPHLTGQAICGNCRHEWVQVAEVGTTTLDCPECKRTWGVFKNMVEPKFSWRCNCGEQLFWLTPDGAMCRRCGGITTDWAS